MGDAPAEPTGAQPRAEDPGRRPRLAPSQRLRLLAGQDLELYLQTAARLVLAARPNKWYPDPFGCSDRLRMLAPSARGAAYAGVSLDLTSGLPCLKDVVTVQADRQIAADFVREQESRLAAGKSLDARLQAKLDYYRRALNKYAEVYKKYDINSPNKGRWGCCVCGECGPRHDEILQFVA